MLRKVADFLGLNRAALAVLAVIGCLGLSEELWSHFVALHLRTQVTAPDVAVSVALYMGVIGFAKNLLEGVGYIAGGHLAHRLGPRVALAVSVVPMVAGFLIMGWGTGPWAVVAGALLMTNWEPLSVPAAFDVIGSEVRPERRTVAFAMQSIQKRIPKIIGPAIGGLAFVLAGFWFNLALAFGLIGLAIVLQLLLSRHMRPRPTPVYAPWRTIVAATPPELRELLTAEIFIRWGDWFARDFAVLYVVTLLTREWGWTDQSATTTIGWLLSLMGATALATYIPMAKWVDRSASPRPFIATTFLLFSLFPACLVLLPRVCAALGLPVSAGLALAFIINGLREIGEPARKALITSGFAPPIRARAVGLYWGLRSFAFCPAPLVAAGLWSWVGPDITFLLGSGIGLFGTMWFVTRDGRRARPRPSRESSRQ